MSKRCHGYCPKKHRERTGIYFASDDHLCFANACFHYGAVLGVVVDYHVLAVLNRFPRGLVPRIRDQ